MKTSLIILIALLILILMGISFYNIIPEPRLASDIKIDSLIVNKSKRELIVFSNGIKVKKYRISLGKNSIGHKQFEGDKKTPEGLYFINDKNPNSSYHRNLGISYPNQQDIEFAKRHEKLPGGDIKIHGLRNGIGFIGKFQRYTDWTLGCIAVTNDEIEELYNAVEIGTSILINP